MAKNLVPMDLIFSNPMRIITIDDAGIPLRRSAGSSQRGGHAILCVG